MKLIVEDLAKEYPSPTGALKILNGVSFELSAGETLAVSGPSGSGKSTLLNILGSLDRPTSGRVRLGETDVASLAGDALARFRSRCVGFIFQDHHLLPQCTALENVIVPTLAAPGEGRGARARELLERVGLAERLHAFPAQLSGGERQRVAIARAMVNAPSLLLCDEPTGNLDRDTGRRIGDLFVELASEKAVMLVVVTHDPAFARRFERCAELRDGRLAPRGPDGG